jgi:hypothetical protein
MGSIPFSRKSIVYEDKETGGRYFLRPPCGDTEDAINDFWGKLPDEIFNVKKREKYLSDHPRVMKEINNATIDIVLSGWEGKGFPEFPKDGKPSQCMKWDLKISIIDFYNNQKFLTGEEIKK